MSLKAPHAGDMIGRTTMTQDRRTFLKATALAGAAVAASAVAASPPPAVWQAAARGSDTLPRGLTLATIPRDAGHRPRVRAESGTLAVVGAERDFHENAPTTIDAVLRGDGDIDGLKRLVDKAAAGASAEKYFVAADKATFGPCVTSPEKIVCIGLNYRRHAAETGNPVPK